MTEAVVLASETLEIWVRNITHYNYIYGTSMPVFRQANITDKMTAETRSQAYVIADMLNAVAASALRTSGEPVQSGSAVEPLDGCEMTCFYNPSRGAESARVVLRHAKSPRPVIGYGRTVAAAIETANKEMTRLLNLGS